MTIDRWPHPACLAPEELLKQCEISTGRSGGPGGQHRNKVETRVDITHNPTGIDTHAGERRSLTENRSVAVFRLRLALATQVRTAVPLGECRSELWLSRTRNGKIACSPEHRDFPAMLAEAMDVLAACSWDPPKAALRLACSASQLVRLVKDHAPAFQRLNEERAAKGLHALH